MKLYIPEIMDINIAIRKFADFLNASWDIVNPLLTRRLVAMGKDETYDWMQANWEILVEMEVMAGGCLEVYGQGSDWTGSGRVTSENAPATHYVKIMGRENYVLDLLNNEKVNVDNVIFEELVSFQDGWYKIAPPFDHVLVSDAQQEHGQRVLHIDSVNFELKRIIEIVRSEQLDKIFSVGIYLGDYGIKNWAFTVGEVLNILEQLEVLNIPVLGGDVFISINGVLQHNYDNWYSNPIEGEGHDQYVKRSITYTRDYIDVYCKNQVGDFYFVLVPES